MDIQQYNDCFDKLAKDFPDSLTITVTYYGSGDNFDSFNDYSTPVGFNVDEYDDLLQFALEKSDANFNDDGSTGEIDINIISRTLQVRNSYYVQDCIPGGTTDVDVTSLEGSSQEDTQSPADPLFFDPDAPLFNSSFKEKDDIYVRD